MTTCKSIGYEVYRINFRCKCVCHKLKTTTELPYFIWRTNGTTRKIPQTFSPQLYHIVGTISATPITRRRVTDSTDGTTVDSNETEGNDTEGNSTEKVPDDATTDGGGGGGGGDDGGDATKGGDDNPTTGGGGDDPAPDPPAPTEPPPAE